MVQNRWRDEEAEALEAAAGNDPADRALALRVYTSRLIGSDPDLVQHGGGNTSCKVLRRDLLGDEIRVLHVKGSGWDLGSIEAPGLPGVRLDPLLKLRDLDALSDEDMVNQQRCNLLDSTSPNPSVETLLHAYLPHPFIDHSHATAMLALADLPEAAEVVAELFGDRVALVPYIMPGFGLAKKAAEVFEQKPEVEGMLLVNHGHFTFGDTAKQSYERHIEQVNAVEEYFARKGNRRPPARPVEKVDATRLLPRLRGALAADRPRDAAMPVFDLRQAEHLTAFLARPDMAELSTRGVATPDHVIRTKHPALILEGAAAAGDADALKAAVADWAAAYRSYFERNNTTAGGTKTMLEPVPGLAWVPGLGLLGIGASAKAASAAADLGDQQIRVIELAESVGEFRPIREFDLFETEHWSLEQAKLGKGRPPALQGRIVLVTGGAGAIGRATAAAFKAQGADIFLVDADEGALGAALKGLGRDAGGLALDLTAEGAGEAALAACIERFGGIDILVSNAGAAWGGAMIDLDEALLRKSFELNFFAHQRMAQAASRVFREQGRGHSLLFNASKQAVNPGKDFGAYGLPKAATFFLVRQYALELGAMGVRVNGINADRIRSGLLTDEMIATRSKARGVDAAKYMAGNLLGAEVEARHVGEAFVALALAERTTGHVMTVDGGNIEAALR
ncbi:bifunctional aldolase/short-chain dehydrogenase [Marinibaculum pumilum]|uniref:Bifunctional aldolase/short-chain dehydrogenase n=1 Tax=Marinibaculum pumilum TaxID=1766165 RepID=A0ABV7KV68_9PROT